MATYGNNNWRNNLLAFIGTVQDSFPDSALPHHSDGGSLVSQVALAFRNRFWDISGTVGLLPDYWAITTLFVGPTGPARNSIDQPATAG